MAQAEYPGAVAMYVNEQRTFINQNSHKAIVIHKTGGPGNAQQQAKYFATNPEGHSTHFVVGQDGEVVQCVHLKDGAGGNCCVEQGFDHFWAKFDPIAYYGGGSVNLNTLTISIEHCDPALDNSTALTQAQKIASFKLVAWLCDRYNISVDNIKGHNTIDPKSRARCPGNYPMAELLHFVGGNKMEVPVNWTYDGSTLVAPNGHRVVLGFANAILGGGWPSTLIPLEDEVHVKTFELSHPDLGGGQQQLFQDTKTGACLVLNYSDAKGVFAGHVGEEIMYLRSKENTITEPPPPPAPTAPVPPVPASFFDQLTGAGQTDQAKVVQANAANQPTFAQPPFAQQYAGQQNAANVPFPNAPGANIQQPTQPYVANAPLANAPFPNAPSSSTLVPNNPFAGDANASNPTGAAYPSFLNDNTNQSAKIADLKLKLAAISEEVNKL